MQNVFSTDAVLQRRWGNDRIVQHVSKITCRQPLGQVRTSETKKAPFLRKRPFPWCGNDMERIDGVPRTAERLGAVASVWNHGGMRLAVRLVSALAVCLIAAVSVGPAPASAMPAKLVPGGPAAIYIRPSPDETHYSLMSRQIGGKTSVLGNVQAGGGSIVAFPSSSEDGRVVAVLQTMPSAASHFLILKDGQLFRDITAASDLGTALPVASLDGRFVVYPSAAHSLSSLNVTTGAVTRLCPKCNFGRVTTGVVSPNGKYVAVLEIVEGGGDSQVVIYALDTGRVVARRVAGNGSFGVLRPVWSPDSTMIVYARLLADSSDVYSLSTAGIARRTAFKATTSDVVGHVSSWTSPAWINGRFYMAGFEYINSHSFLSAAYSAATPFDTPQRLATIGPVRGFFVGLLSALVVAWSSHSPR